jgi:hypothetical protein
MPEGIVPWLDCYARRNWLAARADTIARNPPHVELKGFGRGTVGDRRVVGAGKPLGVPYRSSASNTIEFFTARSVR